MSKPVLPLYEFGEFRIDPGKRVLLRGDQSVPLTPKVFDTLLYLVEHTERVIEKEELICALWPDTIVEENNLTQNISALRRILGHGCIVTLPGRGYRFVAEVRKHAAAPPASSATRIAVLPFKPLVAADRDEALELGMADTLITRLSSLRGTVLQPLTSVRKYGAFDQDALAAGRELAVQSVLDGSIQRRGKQIRVTARLISVPDGASLWAQTFDEEFTDVFAVQDIIAERVTAALTLRISADEKKRLTQRSTENVEAYHCYLKGWYHLGKLTPPAIRKGIEFFNQAIDIDPLYALAYAGVADAYRRLPITSDMPPKEAFPKGKAAAMRALEIDDDLAEAHVTLGFINLWYDRDWTASEKEMSRAIELSPSSAHAHMGRTVMFSLLGRREEAIASGERAVELDPLSLIINTNAAWAYYCAGQGAAARARIDKTLEINPDFWVALVFSGRVHLLKHEYSEAIADFTHARQTSGGNSGTIALAGYARALAGDEKQARTILSELKSQSSQSYIPPHNIAILHFALGEREEALRQLERAYHDRDVNLAYLRVDPHWDGFRSDPRFVAFLKRVGF